MFEILKHLHFVLTIAHIEEAKPLMVILKVTTMTYMNGISNTLEVRKIVVIKELYKQEIIIAN